MLLPFCKTSADTALKSAYLTVCSPSFILNLVLFNSASKTLDYFNHIITILKQRKPPLEITTFPFLLYTLKLSSGRLNPFNILNVFSSTCYSLVSLICSGFIKVVLIKVESRNPLKYDAFTA